MRSFATRGALTAVACGALALPAIALAASPVKGGQYSNQKTLSFATVSKNGHSAKIKVFPGTCDNGIGLVATKPAKIAKGKLTYKGQAAFALAHVTANVTVHGKFVTSKKLVWTVKVKSGTCTSSQTTTLTLAK